MTVTYKEMNLDLWNELLSTNNYYTNIRIRGKYAGAVGYVAGKWNIYDEHGEVVNSVIGEHPITFDTLDMIWCHFVNAGALDAEILEATDTMGARCLLNAQNGPVSDSKAAEWYEARTAPEPATKPENGENDNVDHPAHYNSYSREVIDTMEGVMTDEEFAGYLKGNTIKYLARYNLKGRPGEDLDKAIWYLKRLRETVGAREKAATDERLRLAKIRTQELTSLIAPGLMEDED